MPAAPPPELLDFLAPYDAEVRELALKLRRLVLSELGGCHENIYDAYNGVAISYGTSPRTRDGICHVAVYSRHVNLGFHHGADLDDPAGVLEGSGKAIRHLRVASAADLKRPALREFLRKAKAHAGVAPARTRGRVASTIKPVTGAKRRPKKTAVPRSTRRRGRRDSPGRAGGRW